MRLSIAAYDDDDDDGKESETKFGETNNPLIDPYLKNST